jgi:hypothetical protein
MTDLSRLPNRHQLTFTFVPFALAVAFSLFAAIPQPAVDFARAQFLIRSSLLLTAPALFLYVLAFRRDPLSNFWRLYWTFGCLTYLAHFYYAFFILFRADFAAVLLAQGAVVAWSNMAVTALWTLDALLSWISRQRPAPVFWFRAFTHLLVFVSFFLATVIFKDGLIRFLGLTMALAVLAALLLRLSTPSQPSSTSLR